MSPLPLHRQGRAVEAFMSALGQVRETRLTATLAFLISRFPEEFLPLMLGRRASDVGISVEETAEGDRYDVLVKGGRFPVILEGKIGFRQSAAQLLRYVRHIRKAYGRRPGLVVVDTGSSRAQGLNPESDAVKRRVQWIRRKTWTDVARVCKRIVRQRTSFRRDRIAAAVAEDLLAHLEENQMTTDERPEVYLRDLGTRDSVELYFRHNIYKCQAKFFRGAKSNLYFAPYITKPAAKTLSESSLAPVIEGISYISRIREVQVVPTKRLREYLRSRGVRSVSRVVDLIGTRHTGGEVLILLLGSAYRLFMSAVTKTKLRAIDTTKGFGRGAMGARSCTLEELLAASQK